MLELSSKAHADLKRVCHVMSSVLSGRVIQRRGKCFVTIIHPPSKLLKVCFVMRDVSQTIYLTRATSDVLYSKPFSDSFRFQSRRSRLVMRHISLSLVVLRNQRTIDHGFHGHLNVDVKSAIKGVLLHKSGLKDYKYGSCNPILSPKVRNRNRYIYMTILTQCSGKPYP